MTTDTEAEDIGMFLPILPAREVVVYPEVVSSLYVGREASVKAIEMAMLSDQKIVLLAQKDPNADGIGANDLYSTGVIAKILQFFRLPNGTLKVLLEGSHRVKCLDIEKTGKYFTGSFEVLFTSESDEPLLVSVRMLHKYLDRYVALQPKRLSEKSLKVLKSGKNQGQLADAVAALGLFEPASQQALLEELSLAERYASILKLLDNEIELLEFEKHLKIKVKDSIDQTQRENYLSHQMKVLQDELNGGEELAQLEEDIRAKGMTDEAQEKALSELKKLQMMAPMSAEATVIRHYLDCLLSLPWQQRSELGHDLKQAKDILDRDHYGLEKVKTRLIEFVAVLSRVKKVGGSILCLVGPPGVGKTSLGESIAAATGREFIRIALGGVHDEAEIRGHRRTYIGSMPGKIIQKLAKVKVRNPIIMFDEIDKMGMDHRGDPASALLEVLDSEQNHQFDDHYLEVGFDLSEVMFITTANSLAIPPALLDRMEVIRLPGYTENEKASIAKRYLLPKQLKLTGLKPSDIAVSKQAVLDIIRYYTNEAGVRSLERHMASICRKVVTQYAMNERDKSALINTSTLESFLGVRNYLPDVRQHQASVGQVTGLAWTEVGGKLLTIESMVVPGKGKSQYTGSLGDVMQESIAAALTVIRSRAHQFEFGADFYYQHDVHIHVPEGATPKDGPSAGIGMCTAILSSFLNKPLRPDLAMTGEITLRGDVLAIGGLKEKCLAALRGGISTVIIPHDNMKDLKDFPNYLIKGLTVHPVKTIDEVWTLAFVTPIHVEHQAPPASCGMPVHHHKEISTQY